MKAYFTIGIVCVVLFFVMMEILSRPAEQRPAPIINAYETREKKPAAAPPHKSTATNEGAIRLSLKELESNPKQYVGKRVAVDDKLMVWAIKSYYELLCGDWPIDAPGPCIPSGGPRNPRCEYKVAFSSALFACVPRSKLSSIQGAWAGQQGVRVIGVVAPDSQPGYVNLRDSLIVQPREDTSEAWPK